MAKPRADRSTVATAPTEPRTADGDGIEKEAVSVPMVVGEDGVAHGSGVVEGDGTGTPLPDADASHYPPDAKPLDPPSGEPATSIEQPSYVAIGSSQTWDGRQETAEDPLGGANYAGHGSPGAVEAADAELAARKQKEADDAVAAAKQQEIDDALERARVQEEHDAKLAAEIAAMGSKPVNPGIPTTPVVEEPLDDDGATQRYTVWDHGMLCHNGKDYPPKSVVNLRPDEAKRSVDAGVLTPVK